jgi:hypothetical protein
MKLRDIRRRAKTQYVHEEGFRFIRSYKAERCRTYVAGCPTCDEWKFYDTHGRFTYTFDELWAFSQAQETNDEQEKVD